MTMSTLRLPLLAGIALCVFAPATTMAERPAWTPVAELLVGGLGASDPARMSDVMVRCTALNMLFAGLAKDFSADMSQDYEDEAHTMIGHGVLIESNMEEERTGQKADITLLSGTMVEKVKGTLDGYNEWLDENQANEGFYINDDIELEMDSCKLASKLMAQLAG